MNKIESLKKALTEKRCVKIISGINNFDMENVRNVVLAAEQGGATAVDIAAREDLISMVKQATSLPIFVSSIVPEELKMAYEHGADVLEIGNYESYYKEGLKLSSHEVLDITRRTLELVGHNVWLSVTIPGYLNIQEQISLAMELETLGVHMLQTEGSFNSHIQSTGIRGHFELAWETILNTAELSRSVSIPVMTASGITAMTTPLALASGASAVGIGSAVNKLSSSFEMTVVVKSIMESIHNLRNPHHTHTESYQRI